MKKGQKMKTVESSDLEAILDIENAESNSLAQPSSGEAYSSDLIEYPEMEDMSEESEGLEVLQNFNSVEQRVRELKTADALELKKMARKVGYLPVMPVLPVLNPKVDNPRSHLEVRMNGYYKRMSNWLRGLVIMDNTKNN